MLITIQRTKDPLSFLVRGFGKRAIVVDLPEVIYDNLETDYEVYWLIDALAKAANSYGWKKCKGYFAHFAAYRLRSLISIANSNHCNRIVGTIGDLFDAEHYLNDKFYSPKEHSVWFQNSISVNTEVPGDAI